MASANGDVRQVLSACEAALNVLVDDVASAEPTAGGPGCLHNIGGEEGSASSGFHSCQTSSAASSVIRTAAAVPLTPIHDLTAQRVISHAVSSQPEELNTMRLPFLRRQRAASGAAAAGGTRRGEPRRGVAHGRVRRQRQRDGAGHSCAAGGAEGRAHCRLPVHRCAFCCSRKHVRVVARWDCFLQAIRAWPARQEVAAAHRCVPLSVRTASTSVSTSVYGCPLW